MQTEVIGVARAQGLEVAYIHSKHSRRDLRVFKSTGRGAPARGVYERLLWIRLS